jgi:hypothetical protein
MRGVRPTEWVAGLLAVATALYLAVYFPFVATPRFQLLFREMGGELPPLTRLALRPWFAPASAVLPIASLALAVVRKNGRLLVAAFLLAVGAAGLCLWAMYMPIQELAGKIGAQ